MTGRFSSFVPEALAGGITDGSYRDAGEPVGASGGRPKIEACLLDCGFDMRTARSSGISATIKFLVTSLRAWTLVHRSSGSCCDFATLGDLSSPYKGDRGVNFTGMPRWIAMISLSRR